MNLLGLVIQLLSTASVTVPDPTFTVVAPYHIRQGKPYNIYVRGFNVSSNVQVTVTLSGNSDTGVTSNIVRVVNISKTAPFASIRIDTKNILKGTYSLIVSANNFNEKRTLVYEAKKCTFLIQFNKAIQLPNDLLQYRIFAIDSETNAVNPREANNVTISDPRGNPVVFLKNVAFGRGKYQNKFKISSKASLGMWTLKFQMGQESIEKVFQVSEYKPQLIDAQLTIPLITHVSSGKVPVTIDITYNSGRKIIGTAQFNVSKNGELLVQKNLQINSASTTFDIDILAELKTVNPPLDVFEAFLTFEDPLTNAKAVKNAKFFVLIQRYVFTDTGSSSNFRPGGEYVFRVTVRNYDGSPAPAGLAIQVHSESPATIPDQTLTLGADGTVLSSVVVPVNTSLLHLILSREEAGDVNIFAYPFSDGRPFIDVRVLNTINYGIYSSGVKLNQTVKVQLTTGESVDFAVVHIISKGILLKTMNVNFKTDPSKDSNPRTVTFSFVVSMRYAPSARIFAYYIDKNGTFVTGSSYISVIDDLPNYVKITPTTNEVAPGSSIGLNIESHINSTVSLVAIDQRALLLRNDGNIAKDKVFDDFHKYTMNGAVYDWGNVQVYESDFIQNGLYVISNNQKTPPILSTPETTLVDASFSNIGSLLDGQSVSASLDPTSFVVRKDFRETFLWRDVVIKSPLNNSTLHGLETITEKVPETITKYLIYGVSMSSTKGLGLPTESPYVSAFLPFSITVDFPYSIKRNETLVQDIIIYNFLAQAQSVEVKITRNVKYTGVDLVKYGWTAIPGFFTKTITTIVGQHVKLQFAIKPKFLGLIPFEITARGPIAGDGLRKQLRVVPDGIPRTITRSILISIDSPTTPINEELQCDLPSTAYPDTTEVSASVTGDIFGKTLNNLEKLIRFPYGSCEPIVSALIPNIVIYRYLQATSQLTPTLQEEIETNITTAYQAILYCQQFEGSFAIFANGNPSVWVTAYIAQYLDLIHDIIANDLNITNRAAEFVSQLQNADGSFNEVGQVTYFRIQVGNGNGVALTAFCSIMFSNLLSKYPQYAAVRDRSVTYLEGQFSAASSTYDLGIIAYALQLAGSVRAVEAYNLFYARGSQSATLMHWRATSSPPSPYEYQARSIDLEITAYGLLNVIKMDGNNPSVSKIVRYLVSKSNVYGGYASSHDTVITLYALSQYSNAYVPNGNVDLTLTPNVGTAVTALISFANSLVLQTFQLNSTARSLSIHGSSTTSGVAVVSLTCNFYEDSSKVVPQFEITYNFTKLCMTEVQIRACVKYLPNGSSNMAIMVVTLPSGFIISQFYQIRDLDASLVEKTKEGSEINFYFHRINNTGSCVTFEIERTKTVTDLKDGFIQVFDYYDTSIQGLVFYPIPLSSNYC